MVTHPTLGAHQSRACSSYASTGVPRSAAAAHRRSKGSEAEAEATPGASGTVAASVDVWTGEDQPEGPTEFSARTRQR
eukprot:scaffold11429_cov109-Isochrysis_galbana.AAC.4